MAHSPSTSRLKRKRTPPSLEHGASPCSRCECAFVWSGAPQLGDPDFFDYSSAMWLKSTKNIYSKRKKRTPTTWEVLELEAHLQFHGIVETSDESLREWITMRRLSLLQSGKAKKKYGRKYFPVVAYSEEGEVLHRVPVDHVRVLYTDDNTYDDCRLEDLLFSCPEGRELKKLETMLRNKKKHHRAHILERVLSISHAY